MTNNFVTIYSQYDVYLSRPKYDIENIVNIGIAKLFVENCYRMIQKNHTPIHWSKIWNRAKMKFCPSTS